MRRSMTIVALLCALAMECGTNFFGSRAEAATIVVFDNGKTLFSYTTEGTISRPKVSASLIMSDGALTRGRIWYDLGDTATTGVYHFSVEGVKGKLTGSMDPTFSVFGGNGWYYEAVRSEIKNIFGVYKLNSEVSVDGLFAIIGPIESFYHETWTTFTGGLSFPVKWSTAVYFPPEKFDLPFMDLSRYLVNIPVEVNVPEPASFAIVALGGFALLRRRR